MLGYLMGRGCDDDGRYERCGDTTTTRRPMELLSQQLDDIVAHGAQ